MDFLVGAPTTLNCLKTEENIRIYENKTSLLKAVQYSVISKNAKNEIFKICADVIVC